MYVFTDGETLNLKNASYIEGKHNYAIKHISLTIFFYLEYSL